MQQVRDNDAVSGFAGIAPAWRHSSCLELRLWSGFAERDFAAELEAAELEEDMELIIEPVAESDSAFLDFGREAVGVHPQ